jgi:hypothetical protein
MLEQEKEKGTGDGSGAGNPGQIPPQRSPQPEARGRERTATYADGAAIAR